MGGALKARSGAEGKWLAEFVSFDVASVSSKIFLLCLCIVALDLTV